MALGVGGGGGEVAREVGEGFFRRAGFVLHAGAEQVDYGAFGLELGGGGEVGLGFVPLLMVTVQLAAADVEVSLRGAGDLLSKSVEKRLVGAVGDEARG